ncbi:MAG: EAL domain-containing protein, partial [Acetivibrio ethanolgignens]
GYYKLPDLSGNSVNISRVHIFVPELCDKITNLVHKYDIPLEMLELEFTESAFVSNLDTLYQIMEQLRKQGFTLSMDDFGSGYSSLNMLKNSPVDVIKIDREFLNESTSSENGRVIIRNTISMLRQLKMQIVAEGVETGEQADFLFASGCSVAQGYYYSKPVDISSFEEFAKFTK